MARFNTLNKALMATALGAVLTSASLAQEAPAWIETDSQRQGYEIAERSDNSDNGFGDSRGEARMVLRTVHQAAGQKCFHLGGKGKAVLDVRII